VIFYPVRVSGSLCLIGYGVKEILQPKKNSDLGATHVRALLRVPITNSTTCLSVYLSICLSVYLSIYNIWPISSVKKVLLVTLLTPFINIDSHRPWCTTS